MPWSQGDASWSVGPQAACSGSHGAGLQRTAFMPCPAGGSNVVGGAGVASPAGVLPGQSLLGWCSSSACCFQRVGGAVATES